MNPSVIIKLENVICSWAALDKPFGEADDEKRYILRVMFKKDDVANIQAIENGCKTIISKLNGDSKVKKIKLPIYSDGADGANPMPDYYCFNAKSTIKPSIVDADKKCFEPQSWEDFKFGTIVNMVVTLRLYDFKGSVGISKYLSAVQRVGLDENLKSQAPTSAEKVDYTSYFDAISNISSATRKALEMEI